MVPKQGFFQACRLKINIALSLQRHLISVYSLKYLQDQARKANIDLNKAGKRFEPLASYYRALNEGSQGKPWLCTWKYCNLMSLSVIQ